MVFNLGKHGPDGKYAVIIDVGSGSVGIAIVASDPHEKYPHFIWHIRERMVIRGQSESNDLVKHISTALLNAVLRLGSEGIKVLKAHDEHAKLDHMQVTISAPWTSTVSKIITYTSDKQFEITKKLIKELSTKAYEQSIKAIENEVAFKDARLELIDQKTIDIRANDYSVQDPIGENAQRLSILHLTTVSYKSIIDMLDESKQKVIPNITLTTHSFLYIFYSVVKNMNIHTKELCLIDVTSEATELGIVRDGSLTYSTHVPFGIYTLARVIAEDCGVPHEEALGYLRSPEIEKDKPKMKEIITAFEKELAHLFSKTGDSLSIPKTIFLHTDQKYEPFLAKRIEGASRIATHNDHAVHLLTSALLEQDPDFDTALLLSAYFFHTERASNEHTKHN